METLWSRPLDMRPSVKTLAVTSDVLIVAERWSRLAGLDPGTGALLWEQRVENCWGTTALAGGHCLYLSQSGVLRCLDLLTGEPVWSTPGFKLHQYLTVSDDLVLTGGWRGYEPLRRIDLLDGTVRPGGEEAVGSLAWPLSVPGTGGVLLAAADRPVLELQDARTGARLGKWELPAPVRFPDAGPAFSVGADGTVVFLCGARTVLGFDLDRGLRLLWEHDRDLRAEPPLWHEGRLWSFERDRVAVADPDRRSINRVAVAFRAVVAVPGGVVGAGADSALVAVDPTGRTTDRAQLPRCAYGLAAGGDSVVYALVKGRLTAFDVGWGRTVVGPLRSGMTADETEAGN